jgi:hypothetical protein
MHKFVIDQPLRLVRGYGILGLVYLPLLCLLMFAEGAIQGQWPWSAPSFVDHVGSFSVLAAGIVVGGILAVPVHLLVARWVARHTRRPWLAIANGASGIIALAALAFGWIIVAVYPVSFLIAAGVFGLLTAQCSQPTIVPA